MHVYNDLMFLLVSFDSVMLGIDNVICEDKKYRFRGLKLHFLGMTTCSSILGFCWAMFFVLLGKTLS
jgi:hypothetical protein